MWFYVYFLKDGRYLFDKTCGTRQSAQERVQKLTERGKIAVWLQDHLIKGAFY